MSTCRQAYSRQKVFADIGSRSSKVMAFHKADFEEEITKIFS